MQPVTAVQSEFSLWARDPEPEVLPTCEALGIGFVPWSPLGHGFLTGTVDPAVGFDKGDIRAVFRRFTPDARQANQPLVNLLELTADDLREIETAATRIRVHGARGTGEERYL